MKVRELLPLLQSSTYVYVRTLAEMDYKDAKGRVEKLINSNAPWMDYEVQQIKANLGAEIIICAA